ncbi:ATP-binding protein [Bartonella sp. cb54]|uniref:ATP-binding protein n=1 Tax=Bartonella sp. cb54 TaxID=3385560 RepID=UPI0039A59C74
MGNSALKKRQERGNIQQFSIKENLVGRVRRFPKPSTSREALQPVFEAVSNAIHALEDSAQGSYRADGEIDIKIENTNKNKLLKIVIKDNGIGLDNEHFQAFCTVDTDFKLQKGGKGVGRLLWLQAFDKIKINSVFFEKDKFYRRSFDFCLENDNQILNYSKIPLINPEITGTEIIFQGLKDDTYKNYFPRKVETIIDHLGSHFFSDLILERLPKINFCDGSCLLPVDLMKMIRGYLVENRGETTFETEEFGLLKIHNFICTPSASYNFKDNHQLHFSAHNRTVITKSVDGLINSEKFGNNQDLVYHGCVSGQYLDDRVNQERTAFSFSDDILKKIIRAVVDKILDDVLSEENEKYEKKRLDKLKKFCEEYPSYRLDSYENLLKKLPKSAKNEEEFVKVLAIYKLRKDKDQNKRVEEIYSKIINGKTNTKSFSDEIFKLADDVKDGEKRQLAEYVIRRDVILDILEKLIIEVKEANSDKSNKEVRHLEKTLHTLICPMHIRGDDPQTSNNPNHDLWIIDERLTFTRYFCSDVPFNKIMTSSTARLRADLLCYDRVHALGRVCPSDVDLDRLMLVEFKRPGKTQHKIGYSPDYQIKKYLNELQGNRIKTFDNKSIKISDKCVFYCYIIADIEGELDIQTSDWQETANGRGRILSLHGKFRGTIEIIEWHDLLVDAKLRNQAFISQLKV